MAVSQLRSLEVKDSKRSLTAVAVVGLLCCVPVACASSSAHESSAGGAMSEGGAAVAAGAPSSAGSFDGSSAGNSAIVAGNGGFESTGIAGSSAGAAHGGTTSAGGATNGAGSGGSSGEGTVGVPGVRIVGRTAPGSTGTRLEWSGSSVSARFMGTQVSAQINDGNNGNSFEVVVDGVQPKKLFTSSGQTTLVLASGLTSGVHELLLWRDTEANGGPSEFIGLTNFGPGGMLLAPPPAPDRRIELVGDSFSAGAGIEGGGSVPCSGNKVENHYLSYGAIAARSVKADLVTIAWSSIGVWRNYGTATPTPTTVMPARYDYAIPTDKTAWDFAKYQPHVVVLNLTNNDFSVGDPGQPYIDAYLKLVRHIRANYPNAYIMNTIQWATADTVINQMVATLKSGGDINVGAFDLRPYANRKACDHPDMAASQAMGDALSGELRRVLGW